MPDYSLQVSLHARADLNAIAEYTLDRWGRGAQTAYLAALAKILSELRNQPELGRKRPDLGPGIRSILSGQHVVIYTVRGDTVRIFRILHQRMDASSALSE